jgi:microcystin-dependent protein
MALNKKTDQVFVGSSPKPLPITGKPFDPISRYLLDELKRQQSLINQLSQAIVVTADAEPASPRQGMVRRAISPWDPLGTGYEGLVEFDGTNWTQVTGVDFAVTDFAKTILDDVDAAAVQATLGLGTAAVEDVGTGPGNVVQLDGSSKLPAVDGSQLTNIIIPPGVPTGTVFPFAGSTEPSGGYLMCFGQAVSRTTESALFDVIGTTYGVGDGSTTFNVPDLRGRAVAGQDDMGGVSANRLTGLSGGVNGDTLGAAGGAETHTLVIGEIPAHTHSTPTTDGSSNAANGTSSRPSNSDGVSGSAGGGGAHNNVQPTLILNYIIKT